ncbi:Pentatricopeptide repeat-containing protein [Thalictrum thalictroides]|uniref:Pentatricopeptide repeat-containing protein n=1 Tax=Thalictrum thalictroides TaxID=46969 RepID=A0A7J6VER5_THATH|nr:Pentatricopeptide repeat-containing protein [Thalictrum thalictroides]
MFDHAFKLFDELPQLNCQRTLLSFNALLSACVASKQFNKVEELFREMPLKLSISPDVATYNTVIQALCKMGSFDSAESMLAEMESNGVTPSLITFNTIMHGFYFNGRFSDGERIWATMEKSGIAPDIVSYNGKMQGLLLNGGKISEAVELFKELHSSKVKPNHISYNFLIKAYCNDGNLEAVIRTYNRLLKNGYIPNRTTLEMLIPSICEKGDIDHARKICEENVSVNCYISVGTLQTVVDGLVEVSRTEEAEKLVKLATSKMYAYYSQVKMPTKDE